MLSLPFIRDRIRGALPVAPRSSALTWPTRIAGTSASLLLQQSPKRLLYLPADRGILQSGDAHR